MNSIKAQIAIFFGIIALLLSGCAATETHKTVETQSVVTLNTSYGGAKYPLVVGKFANRSTYMNGIFSDGTDRMGSQAKTILKTHLSQTNRFNLMDRDNMENIAAEAKLSGENQSIAGAKLVVTGEVTEFGRKVTGDKALFGILGQGKKQIAYAKVSLNIVDVHTSEIIHSVQGAGEYMLSNREILGFGGSAGYDATLTAKVLNFAIIDVVNKLVANLENGQWSLTQ
ncbi:MAG: CsgG/HfaB family protein [Desulfobacteraceae bacterium]|jgi:curli biogenesis system outer membrane secretion channel CsgG